MISLLAMTVPYYLGSDSWKTEFAFAQPTNNDIIQITSTSTYTDDFGNFHVIGEVNNTSTQPQSNIVVTAVLTDTNNNILVGNYSAFSSISTLRQGELSPFDIVIENPQQILGKFNFMEFSTSSQPAIEKPANLVLNGSNAFIDNVGNPHITGNMINLGQSPEQFLNLVTTFYDNSSLGVVGTQSFGLNVGSLANNQMAPFDITITDNKTKSQGAFYSLNVDSDQSSMSPPFNPKLSFEQVGGFIDNGLFLDSPLNTDPGFTNDVDSNNNNPSSSTSDNGNSGSDSGNDMEVDVDVAESRLSPGSDQTYEVTVSDTDTGDEISGAIVDGKVKYATGDFDNKGRFDNKVTDGDGKVKHTWQIGGNTREGTLTVIVNVDANGYNSETGSTSFEVIKNLTDTNDTSSQNNSTADAENNNSTLANGEQIESNNDDLDCEDIGETNIPVGDDDPNNLDGDNDGIGCESDEGNNDRSNNEEEDGGTTNESSDTNTEQADGEGDGISNEQPTEGEENTDGNGDSENEGQDNTENESDENSEEQDDNTGSEETNDDNSEDDGN